MNELKKAKAYSIIISVSDLESLVKWYEEKLGFERVSQNAVQIFNTKIQFLSLNGFHLELIEDAGMQISERVMPPGHTKQQGITNFCFLTSNLGKVKMGLEEKSVPIIWSSENADLGMKMLLIKDLEGNLIQYLEKTKQKHGN